VVGSVWMVGRGVVALCGGSAPDGRQLEDLHLARLHLD
jgi:hypothetical protein